MCAEPLGRARIGYLVLKKTRLAPTLAPPSLWSVPIRPTFREIGRYGHLCSAVPSCSWNDTSSMFFVCQRKKKKAESEDTWLS